MSFLHVSLLGPPIVHWRDAHLHIPRRQTRALLFRLSAHMQPVSRDDLCNLFWADRPDSVARRNLTHLLTHLKCALPAAQMLMTDSDLVMLDVEQIYSDSAELEGRLAANSPVDIALLAPITSLYRGSFLAGFTLDESAEYDAWVAQERIVWEEAFLEALKLLIDAHSAVGELTEAIALGQRYLRINSSDEEIHQRLIELYGATGNRAAASEQYHLCVEILWRELGVGPLPLTRELYEAAIAGQLAH